MSKTKKLWLVIICIVIFLILTNPGFKSFKEFKGIHPYAEYNMHVKRNYNFLLFSIYQQANDDAGNYGSYYYFGIALNFFGFSYHSY